MVGIGVLNKVEPRSHQINLHLESYSVETKSEKQQGMSVLFQVESCTESFWDIGELEIQKLVYSKKDMFYRKKLGSISPPSTLVGAEDIPGTHTW